jgi:hypothetical protein
MKVRILIALGALAIMLAAAPAQAQSVSVGWNLLHIAEDGADDFANLPAGWYADVAAPIAPSLRVVGQATGNYKEVDEINFSIHTFMGGVRYTATSAVSPFVQVLYGVARSRYSFLGIDESENDGALQLGAGVDVKGGGAVGVRIGADYIRAFTEGEGTNAFRLGVGVTFGN